MQISDTIQLLSDYKAEKDEHAFKERMLQLADEGELAFLRDRLKGHFTASAWVIDPHERRALLVLHAKIALWLQPGGHADGNFNLHKIAQKELLEETGLYGDSFWGNGIFDLDIHTIAERKDVPEHEHFDVRFLFKAKVSDMLIINSESKDIRWLNIDEIPELVGYSPSICRMVQKSKAFLD
jgi:8-oxo-dGTP pyrophosphatase MutT (NUDIX family)